MPEQETDSPCETPIAPGALIRQHMNRRTLARILGTKDEELDPFLPKEVSDHFRGVVIAEMRRFLELILDVISTIEAGPPPADRRKPGAPDGA